MRILLDGMGGDHAPVETVKGAVEASEMMDHEILIIGREDDINAELSKYKYDNTKIKVVNATEVIEGHDAPVKAVRTKKDSSIVRGVSMVRDGEGDVFVSAGNTGALMAAGLFILRRISGIDRPALASVYPVKNRYPSLLVDAGANTECKSNNLLEFAMMGSIYMEKVLGIENPRVGLVNVGTEDSKGNSLTKASFELLEKSHLNFIGNIEARDIPLGVTDVIVCDGFVGNVILKLSEGLGISISEQLKEKLTEGFLTKIGAAMVYNKIKDLKKSFDYTEYGGAPILGIKGTVVKMHGSSNAKAVKNTLLKAVPFVEENVVETIENTVLEIEEIIISE
ncbi:MAG: phosphate acyltransferase PlsX [Anaerovoracaceae bacterium]